MKTGIDTLYLSDLDGTLLCSDQKTSNYTNRVINELIQKGMRFSYATARSYVTASKAAAGLLVPMPLIIYNGAFIVENQTNNVLYSSCFSKKETEEIASLLQEQTDPIVYSCIGGAEKFSYCPSKINTQTSAFLESRKGDKRENPIQEKQDLFAGEVFHVTCIDNKERLRPLYESMRDTFYCVFERDIYSGDQWLEIMPRHATKAGAALKLKEMIGCKKIVSFGDGLNDIPLFQISDECYAMSHAAEELKQIATGVIGSNDEDAVANWLLSHWNSADCKHR